MYNGEVDALYIRKTVISPMYNGEVDASIYKEDWAVLYIETIPYYIECLYSRHTWTKLLQTLRFLIVFISETSTVTPEFFFFLSFWHGLINA